MSIDTPNIIRRARSKLSLNQKDFASHLGKTQGVISRYENGQVKPPTDVVMHCMHILNEDPLSADIETVVAKVRLLDHEQHNGIRKALNLLLDLYIEKPSS
ncbi:MAG: type II toxin-antitoxin system MqsA family antitoxin [Gammaproteobacteria bacterium]|nr:type II toxin-antitoxin system MqsA family antitoxin [Gammaproteobacteria bacterium]